MSCLIESKENAKYREKTREFSRLSLISRVSCSLFAVILLCVITPAQTDQPQSKNKNDRQNRESLVRIETELVQIDIVVADKNGKLVRDLKREDFELFEDGKKQQITHFAAGTATRPATWLRVNKKTDAKGAVAVAAGAEAGAERYLVIAVDDFHIAPENLLIAKRTLQRFINEQMVAGDRIAVVTTSGNVGMFQQFTNEREVLERAIDRLSVQTREATSRYDSPRMTDYQAELIDLGDREALELAVQEVARAEGRNVGPPSSGGGGGRGGQGGQGGQGSQPEGTTVREMIENRARSMARMIINQNASYSRTTLDTLEGVIRSLRGLPGRKMLVLLSDGFYLGGRSASQVFDIRQITDAATRAGVVIYSIDTRGLIASPPGGDAAQPSGFIIPQLAGAQSRIETGAIQARRNGINALAVDTGGFLVRDNNDLNFGLQRVLDDNEVYYVLAYEPPESRRDGRFHKIEVRIADRPELKARTRKGYFAPAERPVEKQKEKPSEKIVQETQAAKSSQLKSGIASLFPLRDLPIELSADFVDTQERGLAVIINAYIDASALAFQQTNGLHIDALETTVAIFDERGKVVHSYGDRLNLSIKPETLETAVKQGFSYRSTISLKPGFYQARIAVREEGTARLGSASDWVEIPDLSRKQLTLSSILLSVGEDSQTVKEENYRPRPSTAKRRFKRGGKIDFLLFTYNAKLEKGSPDVVIQSQVYSGSKMVYASPLAKIPASADPSRLPFAARISLAGFDAGEYELLLMAIDRATKATAYRRVNFSVE